MAWWKKFVAQPKPVEREVKTQKVDVREVAKVKNVSVKRLNDKDKDVIKRIEKELLIAGVLAPREEKFEVTDRIEDILRIAEEQGLQNVKELVGDFELDERISSGHGSGNLMLDDFDELEDTVYDVYEDTDFDSETISVKADGDDGSVALRLPDGTTIFGTIPGHS